MPALCKVYLLGAGPGDPELLTLKALRILEAAQIVLYDSLVSEEILARIPAAAERVDVGKRAGHRLLTQEEINSLLIAAAQRHEIVVRLKGGDPLLFGRAAEEIQALRHQNIEVEIVPGVSAGFAAAAAAQISLTDRRVASRVVFTTFSRSEEGGVLPAPELSADTTLVVYMPGTDYAEVSRWLLEAGLSAEMPVIAVSKASRADETTHATTVGGLASVKALPAPTLLIAGRVAAQSEGYTGASHWSEALTLRDSLGTHIF